MNIVIEKAELSDYEEVMRIISQVQDMHVKWRPDIYKSIDFMITITEYKSLIENETFFIAKDGNTIAGIISFDYNRVENPILVKRDYIEVDMIAVIEKYRNHGIGHMMFDYIKEIAVNKGINSIELQVSSNNMNALSMYKNYGFKDKYVKMELKIDE